MGAVTRETGRFVPASEVVDWIRRAILDERGLIHNPDHVRLRMARIGVLWTDLPARRQMRAIVSQAEMPQPRGSARFEWLHELWWQRG